MSKPRKRAPVKRKTARRNTPANRCEQCPETGKPCKACQSRRRRELALQKNPQMQPKCRVPRCEACPPPGPACYACKAAQRRKLRAERAERAVAAGLTRSGVPRKARTYGLIRKPKPRTEGPPKPREKKVRKVTDEQRITVARPGLRPVTRYTGPEPSPDLFCCPGCMRKLRGSWRYCERCESKRVHQGERTPDGFNQLPLFIKEEA